MPVRRSAGEAIPADQVAATRIFDAPRALVFEVWTKAEHFARWFGPFGAKVVSCEIDPRPGGVIRFGHRFGDGTTLHLIGTYRKVIQDERLVFTLGFIDEYGRPRGHPMFVDWPLDVVIQTTVVLESVDGGTRVTVGHQVTPPEAASHTAVRRWGELAREGWAQVFARLGEHLLACREKKGPRT